MRALPFAMALATLLAILLFVGVGSASGQSHPAQGYGGGYIQGWVYGYTMFDQLIPLGWIPVTASNSQYSFTTSTGGNGAYDMYLPVGTFNLTAGYSDNAGYKSYSQSITVSDGASINGFNFYLEQSHVPIPEFPPQLFSVAMIIAIAATLIAKRRLKRRE